MLPGPVVRLRRHQQALTCEETGALATAIGRILVVALRERGEREARRPQIEAVRARA